MSRGRALLGLLPRLPTVLRTLAHVRPAQARAQLAHMLRGPRAPVRLGRGAPNLAVDRAATPFLAPSPHVGAAASDAGGARITLLGRSLDVLEGELDWSDAVHGPLWAYHLHEQAWLRHPDLPVATRAALVRDWIARHPRGVGWDPHPISLRLLSWGKLLLTEGALGDAADVSGRSALRAEMAASMADQAETLARGLETRLQANHLLSNLLGVVWAGLLFEGDEADRWVAFAPRFVAELDAQVGADGCHEERSPMYHSLLLESLLDLVNLARVSPRTPEGLAETLDRFAERMASALALFTMPDGRIALLADSAWDVAAEPGALFDYALRLGVIDEEPDPADLAFDGGGYVRLGAGPFDLVASTAGPSPAHQPGHAHCDVAAFELCVDGRRVVTDTGVFEYVPGPRRDLARATRSHATLAFDGHEQSEIWAAHRVGGRVRIGVGDEADDFFTLEVRGWHPSSPAHVRTVFVGAEALTVVDRVQAAGHAAESRWPLAPEWDVTLEDSVAILRDAVDGRALRVELAEGLDWSVERAPFFPRFHEAVERNVLVGRGHTPLDARLRIWVAGRTEGS